MFGRFSNAPLIKEIGEISEGTIDEEQLVSVPNAKVVCANYDVIVHDFPQVFGLEARTANCFESCPACTASNQVCRRAVNEWLIRNSAFISRAHTQSSAVNSPIAVGPDERLAYRPLEYGRAAVLPVDTVTSGHGANFLDVKGIGVAPGKRPSHQTHSSGLEYLGHALADFFYSWLVDTIFARTYPGYHIVPIYAVIDLGFDIINGWHGTSPAGLHVRRAHSRPIPTRYLPMSGSDRERLMLHLELLLRNFGLSTTGSWTSFKLVDEDKGDDLLRNDTPLQPHTDLERDKVTRIANAIRSSHAECLEMINAQITSEGSWEDKQLQMYDFGHIRAYRKFVNPFTNLIRNGALTVGRIISPLDKSFVQPGEHLAVDHDNCNRNVVDAYGFYAARAFRSANFRFDQRSVESLLRIGRIKALRPRFEGGEGLIVSASSPRRAHPRWSCSG